jgi:ribosomal protein S18 acetylase RimI-like enzyme
MTIEIRSPEDNCVVHSKYVHIDLVGTNSAGNITQNIENAHAMALKYGVSKVEISIPATLDPTHQKMFQKYGYTKILSNLSAQPSTLILRYNQLSTNTHACKVNSVDPTRLVNLLSQQANYHHSLYPDYYLAAESINWNEYLLELNTNLTSKKTLQLVSTVHDKEVGFLYGGFEENEFDIWDIIVDESHRGNGIGTEILRHLTELVTQKLTVMTMIGAPSLNWYKKMGFIENELIYYKNV